MTAAEGRRLELATGPLDDLELELLAVGVVRGEPLEGAAAAADRWVQGALGRALRRESYRGRAGESLFLPTPEATPGILVVGLETEVSAPGQRARRFAGLAARAARQRRVGTFGVSVPSNAVGVGDDAIQGLAEGALLGDWSYEELRGGVGDAEDLPAQPPGLAVVHVPEADDPERIRRSLERGRIVAAAQNYARGLVARPGNVCTPRFLASRAERLGEELGLRVETWGPERLRDEGFGGLLAVARGSTEEPRFLILEHGPSGDRPVVLVGKGVTFDSGGLSLKPSEGMKDMKYDMAGAAAVLGTMRGVAELGYERRVVGLVPTTENLPSGSALKPADVIRGVSGISIEVVNTDAEGRLILSDALAYGARMEPDVMVDLATLTGGCVVALGNHAAGLMTPDDGLARELEVAGRRSGERVWRLPLWKAYRKQLDSEVADIKNSGGREASAITAGKFLEEFVGDVPWAHLDIAGTAWAEEAVHDQPKGATGTGVRLLLEWLRRRR